MSSGTTHRTTGSSPGGAGTIKAVALRRAPRASRSVGTTSPLSENVGHDDTRRSARPRLFLHDRDAPSDWYGAHPGRDSRDRRKGLVMRDEVKRTRRLPVGAEVLARGGVEFRVWAPRPKAVH